MQGEHFLLDRAVLLAARGYKQEPQCPTSFSGRLFPLADVLPVRDACSTVLLGVQKPNPTLPLPSRLRGVLAHFLPEFATPTGQSVFSHLSCHGIDVNFSSSQQLGPSCQPTGHHGF